MVVPFSRPVIDETDIEAVVHVLRSGWLTTGEQCARLEEELGAYLGISEVVSMSSCTAALETAVAWLDLPAGSKVAVPTWTFASTALAVAKHRAVPMLLDVDPDTLNASHDALAAAVAAGAAAFVAVHFAGVPIDKEIHELCSSAGLPVIEDAAHALGASDHRGRVAGHGSVGACFSFYATKNVTCAEGGALATDDRRLAGFARSYRLHGMSADSWDRYSVGGSAEYDLKVAGIKGNLPDVLAALARSQLARIDDMQRRRREIAHQYRALLREVDGLQIVPAELDPGGADHLMVVLLPEGVDRRAVIASMTADGIGTSVHFRPLHQCEWFRRNALVGPTGTATADRIAPRALSLPLNPGLGPNDVQRVSESLRAALAG